MLLKLKYRKKIRNKKNSTNIETLRNLYYLYSSYLLNSLDNYYSCEYDEKNLDKIKSWLANFTIIGLQLNLCKYGVCHMVTAVGAALMFNTKTTPLHDAGLREITTDEIIKLIEFKLDQ